MTLKIRSYQPTDFEALYAICLVTGDAGRDATALYEDPELIGHIYAGPYGRLAPESCFVVEDDEGVAGYIVGALDTMAWRDLLEREWWPDLRARYADTSHISEADRTPDEQLIAAIHHPQDAPDIVVASNPAHVHMNLLPRLQGKGMGSKLMQAWLAHAAEKEASSIHLGVSADNPGGAAFWAKQGFEKIDLPDLDEQAIWMRRTV